MQAITAATNWLGGKYLTDCTIYVTLEPCGMCAGAIGWSQASALCLEQLMIRKGYRTVIRFTAASKNQSGRRDNGERMQGDIGENFLKRRDKKNRRS